MIRPDARARGRLLFGAALASLTFAACGGDDPEPDPFTTTTGGGEPEPVAVADPPEFADDPNRICAEIAVGSQLVYEATSPIEDAPSALSYLQALQRARGTGAEKLDSITVPVEQRGAEYEAFIQARRAALEPIADGISAAEGGDLAAYEDALTELERLNRAAELAAANAGLQDCAAVLSPEQEQAVRGVIVVHSTSTDPQEFCQGLATEFYAENGFGGLEQCLEAAEATPLAAEEVQIEELTGIDDAIATATVSLTGGPRDGTTFQVKLLNQDGDWLIEEIATVG